MATRVMTNEGTDRRRPRAPVPTATSFPASIDPKKVRFVSAAFPTGVVLVGAELDGEPVGMLANSFTSVSLNPALLSVNIARTSSTWTALSLAKRWGISILADGQATMFNQLSRKAQARFNSVNWTADASGGLLVDGAAATFIVSREAEIEAGDYVIVLLRVLELERHADRAPLVFYDSHIRRLAGLDHASSLSNRVVT